MARPRPHGFNEPQRVGPAAGRSDRGMAGDPFAQRGTHLRGDGFGSRGHDHVPADTAVASPMTLIEPTAVGCLLRGSDALRDDFGRGHVGRPGYRCAILVRLPLMTR